MLFAVCFAFAQLFASSAAVECSEAYSLASPFIGSGGPGFGYGSLNPGAQYPFSPLRLGPDTTSSVADIDFQHFSGYLYYDSLIRGFSHTHLVGAGVNDLGTIGFMPLNFANKVEDTVEAGSGRIYWSSFNKSSEVAHPGTYSVFLNDPSVQVDLVAIGTHSAIHKYTWKDAGLLKSPGMLLDMCHNSVTNGKDSSPCLDSTITIHGDSNTFEGSVFFSGGLSGQRWYHIYGEIATNYPKVGVSSWRTCTSTKLNENCTSNVESTSSTSGSLFSLINFGRDHVDLAEEAEFSVEVRVGLSWISVDMAKANLQASLAESSDFSYLAERTKSVWCDAMSIFSAEAVAEDGDMQTMLYSALYHTMMSPSRFTETGGFYLGADGVVHNVTEERIALYRDSRATTPNAFEFYSDLSFWDTFRTQHPWLLLINEDIAIGIARSTSEITKQQGAFPRWMLGNHESGCMIGEHGAALVLEAIGSNLGSTFDVATIQQALQKQATQPNVMNGRNDLDHYLTVGYVTSEASGDSTSLTLSYAYDDYVLAGISEFVGDKASARDALVRSQNYRHIWSHSRQFFCPKNSTGDFNCPLSPIGPQAWNEFREGDALHWAWYVMQDPKGLISLFPSDKAFDAALNEFFVKHLDHAPLGSALPNPYYWAGNEHGFHIPFLFNYGPNCTRTQYWSRQSTYLHFSATPHGLPGNDDYGSMSSWILFASLGIFPQAGTTTYLIGSPRVSKATLRMRHFDGSDSYLKIVTYNNSKENVFVEKLLVNGEVYPSAFIDRSVLAAAGGATLEFYMQSTPLSGLCPAATN